MKQITDDVGSAGSRGVRIVPSNRAPKVEGRKISKNIQAPMQCKKRGGALVILEQSAGIVRAGTGRGL